VSTKAEEEALVDALRPVQLQKLRANKHKRHWMRADLGYLTRRIYDEARELSRALQRGAPAEEVRQEAADVCNFAAMVAAVYAAKEDS